MVDNAHSPIEETNPELSQRVSFNPYVLGSASLFADSSSEAQQEVNKNFLREGKIKNDFVQTPKEITEALLKEEKFIGNILEPCCGKGAISKILIKNGYDVISTDKFEYGYGEQKDLFDLREQFDNVITNPPFTQQQKVKKHLLSITKNKIALLWYVKNLGNEIETKTSHNLKAVYVLNEKVNWVETKLGWLFAWYVWEKGWTGDVTIKRINIETNQTNLF